MAIDGAHNVGDPGHVVDHNALDDIVLQLPAPLGPVDVGSFRATIHVPVLLSCQTAALSNLALAGLQTVNSYTLLDGDQILLTAQSTGSQNGPWVAHAGAWVRPTDYASGAVVRGRTVLVNDTGIEWALATTSSVTVDTTSTTWTKTCGYPMASDFGYAAMAVPPDLLGITATAMSNAGTITGAKLLLDHVASITSLDFAIGTVGASLTAGHCGVALFDPSKTLIGTAFTADGATDLATILTGTTGRHTSTLAGTGTGLSGLLPGAYYAVMFQNGTTAAALKCACNSAISNGNLSAAAAKYFTADTGRTTSFPTTLGTFTATSAGNWFAIF